MTNYNPLDFRSQDVAQAQNSERVQLAQRTEDEDLKWVMSNKRGRRFVAQMLERAGVWRLSFNTNALTMAFNEGTRNEGLRLLARITAVCPERYNQMLEEQRNDN